MSSEMPQADLADAPLVLIVDDAPDLRLFVRRVVTKAGWRAEEARDGTDCLARAAALQPDCILLDVHMPDYDGFEVCRRLKAQPETADVPVLFLTADDDPNAVVRGLEAGGNDYIGKPVEKDVLIARVSVALRMHRAEQQERRAKEAAQDAYQKLQIAKADLALAHKMTGLAVMAAGLAHELNSPLSALSTNLQYVVGELSSGGLAGDGMQDCEEALREGLECCARISTVVQRMRALGDNARARSTTPVDVVARLRALGAELQGKYAATFALSGAEEGIVQGVDGELSEALGAVLENAFVAATSQQGQAARVVVRVENEGRLRIFVDDNGPGIADADLPFIFDPFFTRKAAWKSLGLGLGVALSIFTRHGGRIEVFAHGSEGGAAVHIELPVQAADGAVVKRDLPKIPTQR